MAYFNSEGTRDGEFTEVALIDDEQPVAQYHGGAHSHVILIVGDYYSRLKSTTNWDTFLR